MKNATKRSIVLIMAFMLCVGMLSMLAQPAQAATVDYVYSGNYVYNWGTRGTTATFLSPMAEDFYEDNNTSYETLSALSGSSSESGVPSSSLYKTLHNLMESNHDYKTSYDGTKNLFQYTDCQNSGGKISSFYSGNAIGPSWNGGWNREHTWPNSKGDKAGQGENDLMMLRPTATSENSSRSNDAYGQSSGYYNPNSASNGQYDLRGDVARIILYVYVRWECTNTGSGYNPNGIFGTNGVFESKAVLLDWMEADPVDTWELGRNDAAESILGTRNVFVDFPELGFLLYNEDVPADYTTPSGSAAASAYEINAYSANSSYGTVSINGNSVVASPKTGYMTTGYTLISGTATVVQEGNVFTVTPTSDCTIQINFAAKEKATLSVVENGTTVSGISAYVGDTLVLPAHSTDVPEGMTFVGWVLKAVTETNTRPAQIYTPGTAYTVSSANTSIYSLYSYAGEGEGGASDVFKQVTSAPASWEGEYVLTGRKTGSMRIFLADGTTPNANTASKPLDETPITMSGDTLNGVTDAYVIVIESVGNNQYTIRLKGAASTLYLAVTTDSNSALNAVSTVSDQAKWTLATGEGGSVTIKNVAFTSRQIQYNAGSDMFRPYTGTQTAVYLYKAQAGTVTMYATAVGAQCTHNNAYDVPAQAPECDIPGYTAGVYCPDCKEYLSGHEEQPALDHGNAYEVPAQAPTCTEVGYTSGLYCPDCDAYLIGHATQAALNHKNAYEVSAQAPTCTEAGYTAGVYCPDCEKYISGHTEQPSTGHSYNAVVTPPQVGKQGYTTYTCENCSDSYVADYTDPLTGIVITGQPANQSAEKDANAIFTVTATGNGLKYQWYYTSNGENWYTTGLPGAQTAQLTVKALAGRNGYQYRCQITDADKNTVITEAATLTVTEPEVAFAITGQPANRSAEKDTNAIFTVTATGNGLKYQWYYTISGTTWNTTGLPGAQTAQLTVKALAGRNSYQYRCVVTNSAGEKLTSDAATLTVTEPAVAFAITGQPANKSAEKDANAIFTVTATGNGLKYQWYYTSNGENWYTTGLPGAQTAQLTVKALIGRNGYQYRCQITDASGEVLTTNAATLTVAEPAVAFAITGQPDNKNAVVGENAVFTVTATGNGLKYQWYYTSNGENWYTTGLPGAQTAQLTVNALIGRNGYQYRCQITDASGEVLTTNAATLTVNQ